MSGKQPTVGVITYDYVHLKTEQLLLRLQAKDLLRDVTQRTNLVLLGLPYVERPQRSVLLTHRPDQIRSIPTRQLAAAFGLSYVDCTYDYLPDVANIYLVAGAGIFKPAAIGTKRIINAHPGIIPAARGLDAFKWSILEQQPLGVTLHYIDENVDAGEIIAIVKTPIFADDSLETLARRHYESEINILGDFADFLKPGLSTTTAEFESLPARMRMPAALEQRMIEMFDRYKTRFGDVIASPEIYR